jgi:predicted nucleic acid-binding Zn ribbon protein
MTHNEANKADRQHKHETLSLRHERRRIRKMRLIFGVFSIVLLLSMMLSWYLSQ